MAKQNSGIPTVFRGVEYRSRLEARWAAMFDQLGWNYEYEPFDGNGYIPDFLVHDGNLMSPRPLLIEVKPAVTDDDYLEPWNKINEGLHTHWDGDVALIGTSPLPGSMWQSRFFNTVAGAIRYCRGGFCDDCCNAYLSEHDCVIFDDPDMVAPCSHWKWWWQLDRDAACWVRDFDGEMGLAPSGSGVPASSHRTRDHIQHLWANATNEVKWRGR